MFPKSILVLLTLVFASLSLASPLGVNTEGIAQNSPLSVTNEPSLIAVKRETGRDAITLDRGRHVTRSILGDLEEALLDTEPVESRLLDASAVTMSLLSAALGASHRSHAPRSYKDVHRYYFVLSI
ncbi:hypothetical protein BDQ12DRAFT_766627 [Crucibulum laeve]|uniref:Secreted RxLR effector peptide protein n=1 Tax=Crucibulum laeve TaxID=68775 RepID=A0A5C3LL81_9AGAR|nr:hypothetical protein BDQ12DRAFT_766627 [Crucibulum laeve]